MRRYIWLCDESGDWEYWFEEGTPMLDDTAYHKHDMVLASDVADLERRYREAVEIINEFDSYFRGEVFRVDWVRIAAFLAGEEG